MAVLTGVTLVIVDQEFRDQIVQFANADIAAVKDGYRTEGVEEAREVIAAAHGRAGRLRFFPAATRRRGQTGRQSAAHAAATGVLTLPYPSGKPGHAILGVGAFIAPGPLCLFRQRSLHARQAAPAHPAHPDLAVRRRAAAGAGWAARWSAAASCAAPTPWRATCRAIMAGNLASRIPVRGTEDELDRLADTINAMLDRIAALMENLRQVTNDIAHDLRTPVTPSAPAAGTRARAGRTPTEDYDQALEAAIATSDDILALFAALLRIAQIEGGARRAGFRAARSGPAAGADARSVRRRWRKMPGIICDCP